MEWKYLLSEPYRVRQAIAADAVRHCTTVVEVGGWSSNIAPYLHGGYYVCVDPLVEKCEEFDSLFIKGKIEEVDLGKIIDKDRENYAVVILGVDLDISNKLVKLMNGAKVVVLEFPEDWQRGVDFATHWEQQMNGRKKISVGLNFTGNDFGDMTDSWPPRVHRRINIYK